MGGRRVVCACLAVLDLFFLKFFEVARCFASSLICTSKITLSVLFEHPHW